MSWLIKTSRYGNVEMVAVDILWSFREFDRKEQPVWSSQYVSELQNDIQENGIKNPLILRYNQHHRKAILIEGNHRLMIARELGIKALPVRVHRSASKWDDGGIVVRGIEPDQFGYVRADLKPSEIGIPTA